MAVYGQGGLLSGDDAMTYDVSTSMLTVPKISVEKVDSAGVDFMNTPLSSVRVTSGSLTGLTHVKTAKLMVEGVSG